VKHGPDGKMTEGGSETMPIEDAPADVVDIAVRAANLIGDGFYGVDLKQSDDGIVVIEVNDNPSVDLDVEASVLKDEIWRKLIVWYAVRLERRMINRSA